MGAEIWLASGSPRRKTLLEWAGFRVAVHPPHIDEARAPHEDPVIYALRLAREKAATGPATALVLAADTVVHRDGQVFDKPTDRAEARATLAALSGSAHLVTTGVAIRRGSALHMVHATTEVRFRALTAAEIAAYVETGEADDKAGAYGIQGRAAVFVSEVRGSWTNVVGLPVEAVIPVLQRLIGP